LMEKHSFFISFLLQFSFLWPLFFNISSPKNAAAPKRVIRTSKPMAMETKATMRHGYQRSIYHQKKTSRHECRHVNEKESRMALECHQAATAQMMSNHFHHFQQQHQQINLIINNLNNNNNNTNTSTNNTAIISISNDITAKSGDDDEETAEIVMMSSNSPDASAVSSAHFNWCQYLFFLFFLYRLLNYYFSKYFLIGIYSLDSSQYKLTILIRCKFLKIIF